MLCLGDDVSNDITGGSNIKLYLTTIVTTLKETHEKEAFHIIRLMSHLMLCNLMYVLRYDIFVTNM